ncbi:hypothetical protein [Roseospira visakhapatnamensis]|uniref:Uncharacterized protein n=1 Tax=Roseospira visakhapatnamensis TaxID=390880 RepID=A0A7W6RCC1_9PROT|nr:hypothetical protein [Roseospira visakhapatnamensis]MBB4265737.1 hypothetical protein [Roseospira visakhapatnamensis]
MRYEKENPVFDPAYLGDTKLYPAEHVDIFWRRDENFLIRDVEVALAPRDALKNPEKQQRYSQWRKTWTANLGNSCADWMQPNGTTPAEVFGVLLSCGFADHLELKHALREFSSIQGCDWARDMLKGLPVEEDAPDRG